MLTNKNINKNNEKIAGKNNIKNLDEFYGFRMPNKNEATWTSKQFSCIMQWKFQLY